MLPYFEQTMIMVGPFHIFVWGLFVALGIAGTLLFARRETRIAKVPFDHILDLTVWTLVAAFIGARLAHVFFYEPAFFALHPIEALKVWNGGMSSTGGIFFGIAGALAYVWQHKLDIRVYGDIVARSIPVAWIIARFGCYLTHMHPGVHSDLPFAVAYPDGPRLDLGLLESVAWMVIGAIIWIIPRPKKSGVYLALVPLLYAPARFGLDFLRAYDGMMPDARYLALTPAQWSMILLFDLAWIAIYKFDLMKKV